MWGPRDREPKSPVIFVSVGRVLQSIMRSERVRLTQLVSQGRRGDRHTHAFQSEAKSVLLTVPRVETPRGAPTVSTVVP